MAAYAATAPVTSLHFLHLAPVGVLSNLVAVPLCGVVLTSGYAGIALAGIPWVGRACGLLCEAGGRGLLEVAAFASTWRSGSFCVQAPLLPVLVGYYGCLALAASGIGGRAVRGLAVRALLLLVAWVHLGPPPPPAGGAIEATMIDVGQGLAVTLRGPCGAQLLIDSGGSHDARFDPGERIVLPFLLAQGGRRLETLVLTHGHIDHAGGAFAVLREIEVGQLWVGPGARQSSVLSALCDLARRRGTAIVLAEAGRLDTVAGVRLHVLAPPRERARALGNEGTVVLLAGESPARLLVPGDLETEGERSLVASGMPLRAEALVVAHHGSRHGTTRAFLERVRPRWGLISVGRRNPFGHPHPAVLRRLRDSGVLVLRSDESGSVTLVAGPRGWRTRNGSIDAQRHEDEREREDQAQQDGYDRAWRTEPVGLVEQTWMPVAHPQQDREPDEVERKLGEGDRLHDDDDQERGQGRPGDDAMRAPGESVYRVPAVELSDGEQVERGHEESDPARADPPVDGQVARFDERALQQGEQERLTEAGSGRGVRPPGEDLDRFRTKQTEYENGYRYGESRDRARSGHVEQGPPVGDPPADPDHGAEGPQGRHTRQEERKRGGNPVETARRVVPHLVRPEDGERPKRVPPTGREQARQALGTEQVAGGFERSVAGVPDEPSGQAKGEAGPQEEHQVQPAPASGGAPTGSGGQPAHAGRSGVRLRGAFHGGDE
jgi:beta-lactamase superfamily II metal-dependent hydrolase